ncbi:MAG: DUF192 domain-containing protein [Verrucomicrobiota bacterium]|nr:DUF192 domain-containing protein [Verrucomicrobiota bacterium]
MNTFIRLFLFCAFFLAGCSRDHSGPAAAKTVNDYFTIKVGGRDVRMQLAVTPAEMQHGLMGRRDLGPDEGMIFVYTQPQQMSFWMHNTPIPLDIGFFNARGELEEIYSMRPVDESALNSRGRELQFALEMPQDWFENRQVRPGARLDLDALAAALNARDFEPRAFGLERKERER